MLHIGTQLLFSASESSGIFSVYVRKQLKSCGSGKNVDTGAKVPVLNGEMCLDPRPSPENPEVLCLNAALWSVFSLSVRRAAV